MYMVKDRVHRRWKDEEIDRALALRNRGLHSGEIGAAIGRPSGSVRDLFRRLRQPMGQARRQQARILLRTKSPDEVANQLGITIAVLEKWVTESRKPRKLAINIVTQREEIPEFVIEERDRRYAEPRTLTMILLGDPEPSRSALGKAARSNPTEPVQA